MNRLLPFLLVLLVGFPACTSTYSGTYPTLRQTDIRVSWLMTRFRNAATWGRLTSGERERGNAAYSAYKAAYDQALQAANGNANAPTPEHVTTLANEAIRVLSSIPY
jgi:hypothetical protein